MAPTLTASATKPVGARKKNNHNTTNEAPALADIDFSTRSLFDVNITPARALEYLESSKQLRNTPEKSMRALLTDIRNDRYFYTADPIKFDYTGSLIDGQARMAAVVRANTTVRVSIATGVEQVARNVVDTGSRFSLRDALTMASIPQPSAVAAALTSIQAWERGDHLPDADTIEVTTNMGSLAFLHKHPEIKQLAARAHSLAKQLFVLSTKQVALYLWVLERIDSKDSQAFFDQLISGANSGERDPMFLLREILIEEQNKVDRKSRKHLNALVFKAWNAFRDGRELNKLSYKAGGTRPEGFPLPH